MANKFATLRQTDRQTDRQPRIVLINYANFQYKYQQKFCSWISKKFCGFDEVIEYKPESIDSEFREKNSALLNIKRGNGLWLWKPYIIHETLKKFKDGDYIFYCDSGAFLFRNVKNLIDSMNGDIWVSNIELIERQWTKPEVFNLLDIHDENIKNSNQIQASFILLRKSEQSIKFISEWLELARRPELLKPLEPDEFHGDCIEHREDQSLLSILCKLHGIKPHKNPVILPRYNSFRSMIKSQIRKIKKFLGLPIKLKPKGAWDAAIINEPRHDEDKYSRCIFHHRIRKADSMYSLIISLMKLAILRFIP